MDFLQSLLGFKFQCFLRPLFKPSMNSDNPTLPYFRHVAIEQRLTIVCYLKERKKQIKTCMNVNEVYASPRNYCIHVEILS